MVINDLDPVGSLMVLLYGDCSNAGNDSRLLPLSLCCNSPSFPSLPVVLLAIIVVV